MSNADDCWVTYKQNVYDLTGFLDDHPGGYEIILRHGGKDVEESMRDADEHEHTQAAYNLLDSFVIGRLITEAVMPKEDGVAPEKFHFGTNNTETDCDKCHFLDISKPLVRQVWEGNLNKAFYMQQVHQPRHSAHSARMFESDYLEVFTRTSWYIVPLFWSPVALYFFIRSSLQFTGIHLPLLWIPQYADLTSILPASTLKTLLSFFVGNFLWTILEYGTHRLFFHIDDWLPDSRIFLTAHFMMHGIHHFLPMDRLRLVMPPPMLIILSLPIATLAHLILGAPIANGVISGAFAFYIIYDCLHYALHHSKLPAYLRDMKKYHLAHHYMNHELGFGVTSSLIKP
ncbi:oxidoreductase [Sistotremastrum suecicum HHB10207 ss-3]|uniref:Ceramide very long chain fatty acid hydroxylase n=1 Tax=Sistotremastrum suecicum HHB10207 ss-3 TaxID=1314776 RepID=A0A166GED8_9AGAM|nr:oxidoreductase [Sistotremastrum suecicum HHB10207 ss-3]